MDVRVLKEKGPCCQAKGRDCVKRSNSHFDLGTAMVWFLETIPYGRPKVQPLLQLDGMNNKGQ